MPFHSEKAYMQWIWASAIFYINTEYFYCKIVELSSKRSKSTCPIKIAWWTDKQKNVKRDGWTDRKILISHTFTTRGRPVASLGKILPVFFRRKCDWQMDGRRTDRKITLLLHTLTMRGSHVASLVKFHQVVCRISSVITYVGFPFQNNLKRLDPSCKKDIHLKDCFGRENIIL